MTPEGYAATVLTILREEFPNLPAGGGYHADVSEKAVAEYAAAPDPRLELVLDLAERNWRLVPNREMPGRVRLQ